VLLAGAWSAGTGSPALATAPISSAGLLTPAVSVAAAASSCPSAGGVKMPKPATPEAEVTVLGHGWGHGMGMSQYGAQGAARLGCTYRTILQTYYRDTSVVARTLDAPVRLALASASSKATLRAEGRAVTWTAGSSTVKQPADSTWTVKPSTKSGGAGLAVFDADGDRALWVAQGERLSAAHGGTVVVIRPWAGSWQLRTRWDTARFVSTGSTFSVTEAIGASGGRTAVQKYLAGLAEIPTRWPAEALKAQAVAARTYLTSRYNSASGAYLLGTTSAAQVYTGAAHEDQDSALGGHWRDAVDATKGKIIVDGGGRPIEAMYSSSMGGRTEDRQYVYGRYGISYLKSVDDSRWDRASDNPYRSWSAGFSKADIAKRFGFDSVSSWSVPKRGAAARVGGVKITGKDGGVAVTRYFSGSSAKSRLGVRSPGFTFGPVVAPSAASGTAAWRARLSIPRHSD
jgi:SpoIID/LytB domain protein